MTYLDTLNGNSIAATVRTATEGKTVKQYLADTERDYMRNAAHRVEPEATVEPVFLAGFVAGVTAATQHLVNAIEAAQLENAQ